MTECLPDFPRYVCQRGDEWQGADNQNGPWRPIPAPQSGLPWPTDGPAVPESSEPASVAAEARPLSPAAQAVPAGGLVERVEDEVTGQWHQNNREAARAAIREVAAWLDSVGNKGSADELRREVDR